MNNSRFPKPCPAISLILATHNRADLLTQAVSTLLNQSFQNFEILIVDDASEDTTPEVIEALARDDYRIYPIRSENNIGPGAARNLGISSAQGEFIAIMDDDDLADQQRFEKQMLVLQMNPESSLVFSSVEWVDEGIIPMYIFPNIVTQGYFPEDPKNIFKLLYLESNKIPNTTIMTRKSVWEKFSYPNKPWIGEDWYFVMQLAAAGIRMKAIAEPLVLQRRGSNRQGLLQDSLTQAFQSQRQVLRMIKAWLTEHQIHDYDHLHKLALANQVLRESRHYIGVKGLGMIARAYLIAPGNPKVAEQITWYRHKIAQKLSFFSKGS